MSHTMVVILTQLFAASLVGLYGWGFYSIQALQNCILGIDWLCVVSTFALLLMGTTIFATTAFALTLFMSYSDR
ncbi:MAG: hypothetical protein JKY12_05880 [Sneathiella sp.]|nr:hypothetical protein [Sneathiella sp.]